MSNGERKYDGRHAGRGELGERLGVLDEVGPCPSCGAMLAIGQATDPSTKRRAKILTHPMPFCHYFGATDPDQVMRDIRAKAEVH